MTDKIFDFKQKMTADEETRDKSGSLWNFYIYKMTVDEMTIDVNDSLWLHTKMIVEEMTIEKITKMIVEMAIDKMTKIIVEEITIDKMTKMIVEEMTIDKMIVEMAFCFSSHLSSMALFHNL